VKAVLRASVRYRASDDEVAALLAIASFEYERDRNDAQWSQSVCTLILQADDTAATATPPTSDVPSSPSTAKRTRKTRRPT
jgi:hypothetical protein